MAEDYETVVRAWGYNCPEVKKLYFPPKWSFLQKMAQFKLAQNKAVL